MDHVLALQQVRDGAVAVAGCHLGIIDLAVEADLRVQAYGPGEIQHVFELLVFDQQALDRDSARVDQGVMRFGARIELHDGVEGNT